MKISIITISYDNDLEFLKYNLKSLNRFCKDYYENVVVIDDHEDDCTKTRDYLDSINQKYYINQEAKYIEHGYVRQQYIKLYSDQYVSKDTDYICHVDSDSIFTKEHTPDIYFKDQKPVLVKNKYSTLIEARKSVGDHKAFETWQRITSDAVGFPVEYEYMFRMPLVYNYRLFNIVRERLEKLHKCSVLEYLKHKKTFSEYNAIGAIAHKYTPEDYYWVDRWDRTGIMAEITLRDYFGHYSNREKGQPGRYVDLSDKDNIISKLVDNA